MNNSIDRNNPFDESAPTLDMDLLSQLIRQQAQNRPIFENIAILGCGYVGSALADYWQERGHFVTGTTTSRERVASLAKTVSKAVLMKGDDFTAVHSLLQGQDTLVVSVAPTGFQQADEATYETTYITTTKNLVKALSQTPSVTQVIYLSSCSVYGDRQGEWVDETAHIDPLDHKSQVLYEAEQTILQAANDRQKVCVLRLGGIYGPGRELVDMFGGLAGMTIPGKGDRFINWIHRDDIIGAIEFIRLNELEGVYNLVDDSQLTIKEQVKRVCSRYGLPPVDWDSSKLSFQRKSLQVSNQKLKAAGYDLIHPQILV
ncbi:MAG: SDR family oxidoreductase [Leptolyngbyaceae cyanobacterium]